MDASFYERFSELACEYRVLLTKQPPMEFSEAMTTMEEIAYLNHRMHHLHELVGGLFQLISEIFPLQQGITQLPKCVSTIVPSQTSTTGYEIRETGYGAESPQYAGQIFSSAPYGVRLHKEGSDLALQTWVCPLSEQAWTGGAWATVSTVTLETPFIVGLTEEVE